MTATFCRQFYWSDYNLWPEHLPQHTLVSLAGKDRLCPAENIKRWLADHTNAKVMWEPDMRHAGVLTRMDYQQVVLREWVALALAGERAEEIRQRGGDLGGRDLALIAAAAPASAAAEEEGVEEEDSAAELLPAAAAAAPAEPASPAAATGAALLVQQLLAELESDVARVDAQRAANVAAARRLLSLAGGVGRRHTAPGGGRLELLKGAAAASAGAGAGGGGGGYCDAEEVASKGPSAASLAGVMDGYGGGGRGRSALDLGLL
jgi:hypothetical protein